MNIKTITLILTASFTLMGCATNIEANNEKNTKQDLYSISLASVEKEYVYLDPEVKEAAVNFVYKYSQAIEKIVSTQKYQEQLVYVAKNSEVCYKNRISRVLKEEKPQEHFDKLLIDAVGKDKFNKYKEISFGYHLRVHALESLSCDVGGLKVDYKKFKY